jgi:hypothetical protein
LLKNRGKVVWRLIFINSSTTLQIIDIEFNRYEKYKQLNFEKVDNSDGKIKYLNPLMPSLPMVQLAYGTTGLLLVSHGKSLVFQVPQESYFNEFRIIYQDGILMNLRMGY